MHALVALTLTSAFVAAQATWVVDDTPGPGVHFTSLPAAVAAAAHGDTLLVAPGSYQPFHVSGKALSIVGSGVSSTFLENAPVASNANYLAIQSPPPGSTFRMSGLRVRRDLVPPIVNRVAINGTGAATSGVVVLSDVISEPAMNTTSPGGIGLTVNAIRIHASRCGFQGGWVWVIDGIGDFGVTVTNDGVFVMDSSFITGGSPSTYIINQNRGGCGLHVASSQCHVTRSTIRGGDAGTTQFGALGGIALNAEGTSQVLVAGSAANVIRGGDAGWSSWLFPSLGGTGISTSSPAMVSVRGPVVVAGGVGAGSTGSPTAGPSIHTALPARSWLSVSGAVRADGSLLATQPVAFAIDNGSPGQLVALLIDAAPGFTALPGLSGEPLLVSPATLVMTFGLLDAAGHFGTSFVPSVQTPAWVNLPLHWQAFQWSPADAAWLGSNSEHRVFRS